MELLTQMDGFEQSTNVKVSACWVEVVCVVVCVCVGGGALCAYVWKQGALQGGLLLRFLVLFVGSMTGCRRGAGTVAAESAECGGPPASRSLHAPPACILISYPTRSVALPLPHFRHPTRPPPPPPTHTHTHRSSWPQTAPTRWTPRCCVPAASTARSSSRCPTAARSASCSRWGGGVLGGWGGGRASLWPRPAPSLLLLLGLQLGRPLPVA
jgi:hypothetical protein